MNLDNPPSYMTTVEALKTRLERLISEGYGEYQIMVPGFMDSLYTWDGNAEVMGPKEKQVILYGVRTEGN